MRPGQIVRMARPSVRFSPYSWPVGRVGLVRDVVDHALVAQIDRTVRIAYAVEVDLVRAEQ